MTRIHTSDEMDALPVGSVVLDNADAPPSHRASWYRRWPTYQGWRTDQAVRAVIFPAEVVHVPEVTP